jgi:hypothetical protein
MSSDEMSSDEMSSDEMSSDEMSSDEMSSDEMSSDEMSSDESIAVKQIISGIICVAWHGRGGNDAWKGSGNAEITIVT